VSARTGRRGACGTEYYNHHWNQQAPPSAP
jgi:hypothetical protein